MGAKAAAPAGVGQSSIYQGSDNVCPDNCVWVSDEDEVVQDTGAHRDHVDGVGLLIHRRQEAMRSLTQNSKGILRDKSGTRQPVAEYAFS